MKKYPKKPYLISGHRYGQLWLVIPICIFSIFCRGCGIIGAIIIFGIWFCYSIQISEQEWRSECDKGNASTYCPKGYLESQGFKEHHGSHIEEISKIVITQEEINQYKEEIESKKKQLIKMIIDQHNYIEMERMWEKHYSELVDIYNQIKNKTFKYISKKAYNKFNDFIKYDNNEPNLYATRLYLFILINELEFEKRNLFREIMESYGYKSALLSHDAYERIMKGEDIYENYNLG